MNGETTSKAAFILSILLLIYATARNFQAQLEYGLFDVTLDPFAQIKILHSNPDIILAYLTAFAIAIVGVYIKKHRLTNS